MQRRALSSASWGRQRLKGPSRGLHSSVEGWVMSFGSEFWVAVAFFIFCGVLLYVGVHRKIADALNGRQGQIKAELDEARQLRDEAEDLLAQYLRKQHEVEREAADIIAVAEAEANRITGDAKA